jgi:hypothetical protein
MVSKISASGNYGGAEIFEIFFLQGQPNFPPQPSVVGRKILNFFLSMLTKISASGNPGGAEILKSLFFKAKQIFCLSQVW